MATADIANVLRNLLRRDIEKRLVDLGKECANIVVLDIDLRGTPRVDTRRAAGVVLAAQIDIALRVDGL